jgi:AcrR family transcriptional regulator
MTTTPWGDSETLRERQLPPGPGASRAEVSRNQRERLFAATVAVAADKGYAETSVTDIIDAAGVSSSSFYSHFAGKEEAFLATLEVLLSCATARVTNRIEEPGDWEERLRWAVEETVELAIAQPAAACACLVESHAVGAEAIAAVDEAIEVALGEVRRSLGDSGRPKLPHELVAALVAGFRKIFHTHLHRGAERELVERAPEFVELALTYEPPPARLRRPRRTAAPLTPPAIEHGADPGERIVRATMKVVAARGFQATTMADIANAAGVSLSTLYAHFDGKAEAFDAALYGGRSRLLATSLPAHRRGRDGAEALCNGIRASLAFMEAEPEFTRLITTDVYTAGAEALEGRDRALEIGRILIERSLEPYVEEINPFWCEALINILYAAVCEHVQERGTEDLQTLAPLFIYVVLAPFLDAEHACELANGRRRARQASEEREGSGDRGRPSPARYV